MLIPSFVLGLGCALAALALTFVLPIQRGRLNNQLWDLITFALWLAGAYWINYYDMPSNLVLGGLAGLGSIALRDFRLWLARFQDRTYSRGHRYYWYGRARSAWGRRRRRRW
ncbi:MAG: hypothetical protein KA764_03950 [Anaerolineales bacterium]|nr:hypothetical protein [Anaerolineales bacterium]